MNKAVLPLKGVPFMSRKQLYLASGSVIAVLLVAVVWFTFLGYKHQTHRGSYGDVEGPAPQRVDWHKDQYGHVVLDVR